MPVAIDTSLPDYLVRTEQYGRAMRILWQPGDRFRMFFGGKISSKTHKKVKSGEWFWYSPLLHVSKISSKTHKKVKSGEWFCYSPLLHTLVLLLTLTTLFNR